jgi:hypothetical protein
MEPTIEIIVKMYVLKQVAVQNIIIIYKYYIYISLYLYLI